MSTGEPGVGPSPRCLARAADRSAQGFGVFQVGVLIFFRALLGCFVCVLSCFAGRHVTIPKELLRSIPDRLMSESEWRAVGVQQSRGWVHYAIHKWVGCACSFGS